MQIIVTQSIEEDELEGKVSEGVEKLFEKIKEKPELGTIIAGKDLPKGTTLHKIYATTSQGARRLLFFCRHAGDKDRPVRWVLLFYRDKKDAVGENMSKVNPAFSAQLAKNLGRALDDLTSEKPRYKVY